METGKSAPNFARTGDQAATVPLDEDTIEAENDSLLRGEYEKFCSDAGAALATSSNGGDGGGKDEEEEYRKSFAEGSLIWQSVSDAIGKSLNSQIFDSWFKPVIYAGINGENEILYLLASEVNQNWVTSYYQSNIDEAFAEIGMAGFKIKWLTLRTGEAEVIDLKKIENIYPKITAEAYRQSAGAKTFEQFCKERRQQTESL